MRHSDTFVSMIFKYVLIMNILTHLYFYQTKFYLENVKFSILQQALGENNHKGEARNRNFYSLILREHFRIVWFGFYDPQKTKRKTRNILYKYAESQSQALKTDINSMTTHFDSQQRLPSQDIRAQLESLKLLLQEIPWQIYTKE